MFEWFNANGLPLRWMLACAGTVITTLATLAFVAWRYYHTKKQPPQPVAVVGNRRWYELFLLVESSAGPLLTFAILGVVFTFILVWKAPGEGNPARNAYIIATFIVLGGSIAVILLGFLAIAVGKAGQVLTKPEGK